MSSSRDAVVILALHLASSSGPCLIADDGRRVALERHEAALLALVAIDRRVLRARAAELLWPDRPARKAQNNLRQCVFNLRKASGHRLLEGRAWLELGEEVTTDLDGVAGDPSADGVAQPAAAELLGEFRYGDLPDFDAWLAAARAHGSKRRRKAWIAEADRHEAQGAFDAAITLASRLVDDDVLDEAAWRRLMRLRYLAGDRAGALDAYRRCRAQLAQELGVEPDGETQGLARLVERSIMPPPVAPKLLPVALRRTPLLVGRERQRRALERAWQRRAVVLLAGDAGIGKSRLVQGFVQALARRPAAAKPVQPRRQAASAATARALALTYGAEDARSALIMVAARAADAAQPYALIARLLREGLRVLGPLPDGVVDTRELARIVPEIGPAPAAAPAADGERLRVALVAALAHWHDQGARGLIVDDLHAADAASSELLAAWLDDAASARWPHLLVARTGEWPEPLRRWRDSSLGKRALVLELPPLDARGLRALVDSLDLRGVDDPQAWSRRLLAHTGGNPLFVIETLIACHEAGNLQAFGDGAALPAPEGVGRLIDARLARLSAPALRLARMMSVVGDACEPEVLAHALCVSAPDLADPWHELEARHVVHDAGPGFAHDLVAAAVRRSIPDPIARVLHARLGRALLAHGHPPGPVAAHLRAARAWAEAAPQTLRAAQAAAQQGRHDEAVDLLDQAAAAFEACGDHAAAFDARVRRADAMIVTGSLAQVRAELAQLGKRARGDAQRLRLGVTATRAAIEAADGAAAVAAGQAAQRLAQRLGDEAAGFEAGHLLGSALSLIGQGKAALAQLEPMLAAAAARPARDRCAFHGSLGYALGTLGRPRDAVEQLRAAAQLADELGDDAEAMTLWSNLSGVLNQLGRTAEAADVAQRARERTLHAGEKQGIAVGSNETMLGLALGALGRFDDAEQVLAAALERFERAGAAIWAFATEGMLANLYVNLGQLARAKRLLASSIEPMPAARRARRLVVQARLERASGRSGLDALRAAQALLEGGPQRSMDRLGCLTSLSQVVPADEALALLREVRAACESQGMDAFGLSALVREADAWRRAGDARAAAACAREARAAMRECTPHDLYLAECWWLLHTVLDAAGDELGADEALREGVAWLQAVLPQVPPAYRDAFVHRQRVNRLVLTTAARRRLIWAASITIE